MESSYSMDQLIEMLEDLVNDATKVPLSKKSLVDVEKMNEVVQDMRMALPDEVKKAQRIVTDKNEIINAAKQEAENIIRKAEQLRAQMLDENELVREARRRATEMLNAEQTRCADLRNSTDDYINKMLKRIIDLMENDLKELVTIRGSVSGVQNINQSQQVQQQSAIRPMEKPGE